MPIQPDNPILHPRTAHLHPIHFHLLLRQLHIELIPVPGPVSGPGRNHHRIRDCCVVVIRVEGGRGEDGCLDVCCLRRGGRGGAGSARIDVGKNEGLEFVCLG